jgi:hypothetical protein
MRLQRQRYKALGWCILCWMLVACQASGGAPGGPTVVVMNAQGTPIGGTGSQAPGPTATPTPPANLLRNGGFANDWSEGWERDTGGVISGQNITEVIASSSGTSGKAVRLVHDGPAYLALTQVVALDTLNVNLSARVNLMAEASCRGILKTCMGVAGISFMFLDRNHQEVGVITYMYPGNADQLTMASDATRRLILLQPGWQTVRFNVQQELKNTLPSVDPDSIKHLRVMLTAGALGDCSPGQCYAELQATELVVEPLP